MTPILGLSNGDTGWTKSTLPSRDPMMEEMGVEFALGKSCSENRTLLERLRPISGRDVDEATSMDDVRDDVEPVVEHWPNSETSLSVILLRRGDVGERGASDGAKDDLRRIDWGAGRIARRGGDWG